MSRAFWSLIDTISLAVVTTRYASPGFSHATNIATTEAEVEMDIHAAGVMSTLSTYVGTNSYDAALTITSRKNAGDGNMSVSIGAGTTGLFQDLTNSDSIASGDEYCLKLTTATTTGAISISSITMVFNATYGYKGLFSSRVSITTGDVSAAYFPFSGETSTTTYGTNEDNAEHKIKSAGVFSGLCVNVSANSRPNTSTIKSRKNGADGNLLVSIAASTTGRFSDTSNSDSVAVDDTYNLVGATGATAGAITARTFIIFSSSGYQTPVYCGREGSVATIGTSLTRYYAPGGSGVQTLEGLKSTYVGTPVKLSKLSCYVSINGITATSTLSSRVDGADGNQSVSIPSSTTGWFTDSSNSDNVSASSHISEKIVTGASGTNLRITQTQMLQEPIITENTKTVTAKARMEVTQNQSLQAKTRLEVTKDQTIQAKARIEDTSEQTIQAKARIKDTSEATIQAKGRIENITEQTITAKARLKETSSTTIQAKAALSLERTETVDAKARMKTTEDQSVTAKSRIFNTVAQTLTAKARLKETSSATIQAKAKVEFIRTETIGAKSRLKVTQVQTLTAKAAIRNLVTRTITAKAKIWGARIGVTVGIKGRNTVIRGARYTESG